MTGPAFRHWLTGFFFAALAHLVLAAFLMGFWREPPPEPGSAEVPGLEVTLFPGFHQAVRQASPQAPPALAPEALPLDTTLEPAPPVPVLGPEQTPDAVPSVTVEAVATSEVPVRIAADTAARQPPTDSESALRDVSIAEPVETVAAPEVVAIAAPAVPVAPQIAADIPDIASARVELPADFARTLEPSAASPTEAPLDRVMADQPPAPMEMPPSDPVVATASTPTVALAVAPSELASIADPDAAVALEDTPASVVVTSPEAEPITAPMADAPMADAPVADAVIAADPIPAMTDPVIAALGHELAPLVATVAAEIEDVADVAAVDVTVDDVSAETLAAEVVPTTEIQAPAAESVATVETIETTETVALAPETEAVAREIPLPPSAQEPSAPEEDVGREDPPSPEVLPDVAQTATVQDHYFRVLRDWLDRHKDYPRIAQRRGEEGTVVLAFTLNRHGMVLEHAILRSSGHSILDNTVEHLIRRAQPLPAIPPEMNVELLQVVVPIEFRLER